MNKPNKEKAYTSIDGYVRSPETEKQLNELVASVFKDEDGNFDKTAMDVFMKKIYIENIWCFAKNKKFDLFRHTKSNTLEQFFA